MSKLIFIQDIDTKNSPKVRAEIRDDVIKEYAIIYARNKKELPPVVLFTPDGRSYLLGDGAHRLAAARANGAKAVIAEVKRGGYEEALSYALAANERHGIRRSREDKRQCVTTAIKQWPKLSNREIAIVSCVDDHTVKAVRVELEKNAEVTPEPVRETRNGRKVLAQKPAKSESTAEFRTTPEVEATAKAPEKVKDAVGRVIPNFCIPYWNRSGEIKEILLQLSGIMGELKKAQKNEDLMYAGVNISGILADLDRTWTAIQTAIPYTVCTQCQGHPDKQAKGECRMCRGKGMISRFMWDTTVPSEVKNMLKGGAK